jgi:hypothetical protein
MILSKKFILNTIELINVRGFMFSRKIKEKVSFKDKKVLATEK